MVPMGDDSPKNKHKLEEQKHEEHDKKEDEKHENAERQHTHPHHPSSAVQEGEEPKAEAE